MELERWFISQPEVDFTVPDYDSTKANFDELEKRIAAVDEDLSCVSGNNDLAIHEFDDRLTALEERTENIVTLISDKEWNFIKHLTKCIDRLTVLEEQPKAEYFEKLFRDLANRIAALEAKDAPETCGECPEFPGNGNICRWPGNRIVDACMGSCRGVKQPPNTCGNCGKAWRRDDLYGVDVVACNQGEHWMTRYLVETCPHHDRRGEA